MIVAFDADDTLWHNEDTFAETHRAFEELLAPWASAETVDEALYATEIRNLPLYGYGAKSLTLSMTETAVEVSAGAITGDRIRRILALGQAILDRPTRLIDDVVEVLDALSHHTLMLITKGDLHAQRSRIADSGLEDRFWRIEVVAEKNPTTYARLFETHGIAIDDFVMVGNSLRSDVLPVIELGARGVHVPYPLTWAHEADHDEHDHDIPALERLSDLPALIEAWA
jgi:putative hydrolase of the HAD superfamily